MYIYMHLLICNNTNDNNENYIVYAMNMICILVGALFGDSNPQKE